MDYFFTLKNFNKKQSTARFQISFYDSIKILNSTFNNEL